MALQTFEESVAEKMGTTKKLCPFRYNNKMRFEVYAVEPRPDGFLAVMPDNTYRTFYFNKIQNTSL